MTCPAAQRLHARLLELGWQACISYARGPVEFTELSATPRGDGTRERIRITRELDSALVRGAASGGWAIVALWIQDKTTPAGKAGWSCDLVYIPGEHTPQRIGAKAVNDYLDSYVRGERKDAA